MLRNCIQSDQKAHRTAFNRQDGPITRYSRPRCELVPMQHAQNISATNAIEKHRTNLPKAACPDPADLPNARPPESLRLSLDTQDILTHRTARTQYNCRSLQPARDTHKSSRQRPRMPYVTKNTNRNGDGWQSRKICKLRPDRKVTPNAMPQDSLPPVLLAADPKNYDTGQRPSSPLYSKLILEERPQLPLLRGDIPGMSGTADDWRNVITRAPCKIHADRSGGFLQALKGCFETSPVRLF